MILRQNLFQALTRFRGDSPRVLWVDALCISQTNVQEKGQQVQQMGNIFRSADRVLVWLGEHADESEALFEPWPWTASDVIRRAKSAVPNPWSSGRVLTLGELERRQRIWTSFLHRPYFRRTWVIQEIVLAQSLLIHCGGSVISWNQLIRFDFSNRGHPRFDSIPMQLTGGSASSPYTPGDYDFSGLVALLNVIERLRRVSHQLPGYAKDKVLREAKYGFSLTLKKAKDCRASTTITELAHAFSDTHCSDVRDKVYALISLETGPCLRPIIPDYNLTPYQTLLSLARQRAADEWRLAQPRPEYLTELFLEEQERRGAVQKMAANFAKALGLGTDETYFTGGGHLKNLCANINLEEILHVLDVLIEDERKLTEAQQLVKNLRFDKAIAVYPLSQDHAENPRRAQGAQLDVYDVFLAIMRQRLARTPPYLAMNLSSVDDADITVQVARALGIHDEHVDEHGRWCLPERDRFSWSKHGARYYDYDFTQLGTLESAMCALEDFVSRKRAGARETKWPHTPEANQMREDLGLAPDGMPI